MSIFSNAELESNSALTEDQLSTKLGIDKRTLQAWRLRGGGPDFCKFGRAVRYFPIAVDAWAKQSVFSSTSANSEAAR